MSLKVQIITQLKVIQDNLCKICPGQEYQNCVTEFLRQQISQSNIQIREMSANNVCFDNLYLRDKKVLSVNLNKQHYILIRNISMYKSRRHNDPLVGVDEPLNVSVSVEVGRVVAPGPDHRDWLGGKGGRQQGARQDNLRQTL